MNMFQRLLGHGIAVVALDAGITSFERIGLALDARWTDASRGTTTARFPLGDGGYVELLSVDDVAQPDAAEVAAFLAAGGDGLWRTDIEVLDVGAFEPGDEHAEIAPAT